MVYRVYRPLAFVMAMVLILFISQFLIPIGNYHIAAAQDTSRENDQKGSSILTVRAIASIFIYIDNITVPVLLSHNGNVSITELDSLPHFRLHNNQNYTLTVQKEIVYTNADNATFLHWQDNNSTNTTRTVNISKDKELTAVYYYWPHGCDHCRSFSQPGVILPFKVNTIDSSGHEIDRVNVTVLLKNGTTYSSDSPALFRRLPNATTFFVTVPSTIGINDTNSNNTGSCYDFLKWQGIDGFYKGGNVSNRIQVMVNSTNFIQFNFGPFITLMAIYDKCNHQ